MTTGLREGHPEAGLPCDMCGWPVRAGQECWRNPRGKLEHWVCVPKEESPESRDKTDIE